MYVVNNLKQLKNEIDIMFAEWIELKVNLKNGNEIVKMFSDLFSNNLKFEDINNEILKNDMICLNKNISKLDENEKKIIFRYLKVSVNVYLFLQIQNNQNISFILYDRLYWKATISEYILHNGDRNFNKFKIEMDQVGKLYACYHKSKNINIFQMIIGKLKEMFNRYNLNWQLPEMIN